MFLKVIKYWSTVGGAAIGMFFLKIYSHVFIYLQTKKQDIYYSNKTVNKYCNIFLTWFHPVVEIVLYKKVEPFYDPWCSIVYNNDKWYEHYINLNENIHRIPLKPFRQEGALFCMNPVDLVEDTKKCDTIYNIIKNILVIFSHEKMCLIILKIQNRYVCRNNMKNDTEISLEKTRNHILCVEYTHPKMEKSIYLDIDPGYYLLRNEIFSELFVERCLKYQKKPYVFDSSYKLKIMDCMMRTVEMSRNQYMILEKNDYKICTI